MRLAVPGMIEQVPGHIVNVASPAGKFPIPGLAVYNASKFAVVGLSAATRRYADHGVSISTALPSAVDTALSCGFEVLLHCRINRLGLVHRPRRRCLSRALVHPVDVGSEPPRYLVSR